MIRPIRDDIGSVDGHSRAPQATGTRDLCDKLSQSTCLVSGCPEVVVFCPSCSLNGGEISPSNPPAPSSVDELAGKLCLGLDTLTKRRGPGQTTPYDATIDSPGIHEPAVGSQARE
ncbi:hypothetical protein N8I77_011564 [Diaporthe amygdali]|uniref:Uncharacterized protein n=1 Tax=Phomopsis amygdali TaxID=1214568 RepID=A0AAD9VYR7_PHOAM|nr:hypothetical protein N8I77_011564 [Diaporthe amygdali]